MSQEELIQNLRDEVKRLTKEVSELDETVQKYKSKYHKKRPPEDVLDEYHRLSTMKKDLSEKEHDLSKIDKMLKSGKKVRTLYNTCAMCGSEKRLDIKQVRKQCREKMRDDILEVAYRDEESGEIKSVLFKKDKPLEAEELLQKLKADVVFDMHNVLDILPHDEILFDSKYNKRLVCCSYVGAESYGLRTRTLADIKRRIESGQIHWGALVFRREHGNGEYHKRGSKAWLCRQTGAQHFIDDGIDHIESVESLNTGIKVYWVQKPHEVNVDKQMNLMRSNFENKNGSMSGLMKLVERSTTDDSLVGENNITFFNTKLKRTYTSTGACADKKCNNFWTYTSESTDEYDKIYCEKHWRRNVEQKQN